MYTKEDFTKCVFNPMHKDVFKEYDRLEEMKEVINHPEANGVAKYIFAVYDPNSPFIKDFPDSRKRKDEVAYFFDIEKVEGLLDCSNENFVKAVHWFLRNFVRSMDWAVIQANTETFWEYQLRLMTPISKNDNSREKDLISAIQVKSKLAEDLSLIAERIAKHTKLFYGDDEDVIKAQSKMRFTSEKIASVFQNQ